MSRFPWETVLAGITTSNIIQGQRVAQAQRELSRAANELHFWKTKIANHNAHVDVSFANYVSNSLIHMVLANDGYKYLPVNREIKSHLALEGILVNGEFKPNFEKECKKLTNESDYSDRRYSEHIGSIYSYERNSLREQRLAHLRKMAVIMYARMMRYELELIPNFIEFVDKQFTDAEKHHFIERLKRRVTLLTSKSPEDVINWLVEVLESHSQYEDESSIKPIASTLPDVCLVGYVAREYNYDIRSNESLSFQASQELANSFHATA